MKENCCCSPSLNDFDCFGFSSVVKHCNSTRHCCPFQSPSTSTHSLFPSSPFFIKKKTQPPPLTPHQLAKNLFEIAITIYFPSSECSTWRSFRLLATNTHALFEQWCFCGCIILNINNSFIMLRAFVGGIEFSET